MIQTLKAWFIRWRLEQYEEHRAQMQADYHAGMKMIQERIDRMRSELARG